MANRFKGDARFIIALLLLGAGTGLGVVVSDEVEG